VYRVSLAHGSDTAVFTLTSDRVILGSGPEADVRVPVRQVSRRHAELRFTEGRFILRDLGSRNGTFVHGLRIDEAEIAPLMEFSLGPVVGMIEEVSTSDLESALSLGSEVRHRAESMEPVAGTRTDELCPGALIIERVGRRLLENLKNARSSEPAVRESCERLQCLLPGLAVRIERCCGRADAVVFDGGVSAGSGGHSLSLDVGENERLTARWMAPPSVPVGVVEQVLGWHLAALAVYSVNERRSADREQEDVRGSQLVGASAAMKAMLAYARKLAPMPINLLIVGESGTGKELLAREIHEASTRTAAPFVAMNCAALPRDLLEAELFGIEEKVATGVAARPGRFEQAHGGTLFLDEVCDMSVETQAMMLRVLQERSFYRIGGSQPRPADVRVLAATNKIIETELESGRFRRDLYFRIAGDVIVVPPLRHREGDVALLAYRFLERFTASMGRPVAGMSKKALEILVSYQWPGNVRELENEIRRLVALAPVGGLIEASHLSPALRSAGSAGLASRSGGLNERLAEAERHMILAALAEERDNVAAAARRLGVSRPGLYQRMERLGIERASSRE
jgi:DNA-binding NtrC family response regulator